MTEAKRIERPISVTTGLPSQRGKRIRDGLSWKQRNRSAVNARRRKLYSENTSKHRLRASVYRRANAAKVAAVNRIWLSAYRVRLRAETMAAYGGKCNCCGEREQAFLQMDHIHNDGALERKTMRTSTHLWAKLKRLG